MQDSNVPETGPEAIYHALQNIDLAKVEAQAKQDLRSGKKTKRPGAVALLNIVRGMERNGTTPSDYMISSVPVIPCKFRPFAAQGNSLIPGDANVLYKDLFDVRDAHNEEREMFGDENAGQSRLDLYDAIRSVYGYGDPVKPKTKAKEVKGFLQKICGTTAKYSYAQRRLLSKTQDNTGRSTVIVDPELDIDQIGIPKDLAFTMYAPYIQRRLKQGGMKDADALKAVKERSEPALHALEKEVQVRPVVYSRAPAWHMHSVLGGNVKLVEGDAIVTNPFVCNGLGMDFDGDAALSMTYVVFDSSKTEDLSPHQLEIIQKELTKLADFRIDKDMFKNMQLPTVAPNEEIYLVDLEDFPHLDLSNTVHGRKGDIFFYTAIPGTKVLSYDPVDHKLAWKQVSYWSRHPQREIEIVNLAFNHQIYTDDDPRAVYGIPADSESLVPERFTPTQALARGVHVPVTCRCQTVVDDAESKQYATLYTIGHEVYQQKLDFDFGCLLGHLCGDGWWDKKMYASGRAIHVSDLEGYVATFDQQELEAVLGVPVNMSKKQFLCSELEGRYGDTVKYTFRTSFKDNRIAYLTETLTTWLGGEGDKTTAGSANKHLPPFYLVAPREFREGLLCGLVDTDGACAVSNAKKNPQLMLAFSSTSLRLCREVRLLAASVGIRASISFSKVTRAGNKAWMVTFSSVDAKQTNLFSKLKHARKRQVFVDTFVDTSPAHKQEDRVVFPTKLAELMLASLHTPKKTKTPEDAKAKRIWGVANDGRKAGSISRAAARQMLEWLQDDLERRKDTIKRAVEFLSNDVTDCPKETVALIRDAVRAVYPKIHPNSREGRKAAAYTNRASTEGVIPLRTKATLLNWFKGKEAYDPIFNDPDVDTWVRYYVDNESISWSKVISVEKTGQKEDGYDLTVPGYETFISADGVVLSNTVNVHVPSSDAAVKECYEKLMPSTTPFSNREADKIVPLPKQEQILGLYTAATSPTSDPYVFDTEDDAVDAIRRGQIPLSADVEIRKPKS